MMKLSDAIMLGRMVVSPVGGFLLKRDMDGNQHGCALGMACAAISYPVQNQESVEEIWQIWPWTASYTHAFRCFHSKPPFTFAEAIAHIFDQHVCGEYGPPTAPLWTLDELVQWIRTHEPQEEQADGGQGPVAAALEVTAL